MKTTTLSLALIMLAPLFLITVTSSAVYDPWADLDADGDIDIFDVVKVAGAYSTTGDPGKNVTIVGRANKLAYTSETILVGDATFYSPWVSVDGYAKVTICLYTTAVDNWYRLEASHYDGPARFYVEVQDDFGANFVKTYDVPNQQIRVCFGSHDATQTTVHIDVYLVP